LCPGKEIMEIVELEKQMGEAVLLDFSKLSTKGEITFEEIEELIKDESIGIKEEDIAIIKKWPRKWEEEEYFECKGLNLNKSVAK